MWQNTPLSVSLVNTQIYGALNHPRGEYCQLRTFKTQIQLNTNRDPSFTKKVGDSIQIYVNRHGLIRQTSRGGVSLQIRRWWIIHNGSFSARPETNKKRHHRLDNTLDPPLLRCHFKQGTKSEGPSRRSMVIIVLLYDDLSVQRTNDSGKKDFYSSMAVMAALLLC